MDPELADRLRSALAGPERWEARTESEEVTTGRPAAVVPREEVLPTESAERFDDDVVEDAEVESSYETRSFGAYPTMPSSEEADEAFHETEAFLRSIEASPTPADPPLDDLADLIVYESAPTPEDVSGAVAANNQDDPSERATVTDYPTLPSSGDLDEAIEETDATLRRMREHLTSDEPSQPPRRVSRFVTVTAGICAVGAVAVLAADTQLGVATLPGLLRF